MITEEKIWFPLPESDWYTASHESMWATPLEDGTYQLENSPMHVYGVSYKDIIHAKEGEDGLLFFDGIHKKTGHSTYRIIALEHRYDDIFLQYWNPIEALGCSFESNTENWLFSVDVPPEVDIQVIFDYLQKGERDGVWGFEESDRWDFGLQ